VKEVHLLINNTRALFVGAGQGEQLDEIAQRSTSQDYDSAIPLESGWRSVRVQGGWSKQGRVYIQSRDPMPFEILSIRPELVSE
jgi:hypothetical protein